MIESKLCETCGYFNNRGLAIDAVAIENDSVLLIKRGDEPEKGKWALPGGYVEWGELVEDTVRREMHEETNMHVTDMKLLSVNSKPDRHPRQCIAAVYMVQATGIPKAGDDAEDIGWFKISDLPGELAFDHKEIIEQAIAIHVRQ